METIGAPTTGSQTAAAIAPPSRPAYGVSLDPFRPDEVMGAPGVANRPPDCPFCQAALHHIAVNDKGDPAFECLSDGYEAVYRTTEDDRRHRKVNGIDVVGPWEPRPRLGVISTGWRPPALWDVSPPEPPAIPAVADVRPPRVPKVAAEPRAPATARGATKRTAAPAPPVSGPVGTDVEWLTLRDAADIAGTTPNALYQRVKRKTLDSSRSPEGHILVRGDQLGEAEGA